MYKNCSLNEGRNTPSVCPLHQDSRQPSNSVVLDLQDCLYTISKKNFTNLAIGTNIAYDLIIVSPHKLILILLHFVKFKLSL